MVTLVGGLAAGKGGGVGLGVGLTEVLGVAVAVEADLGSLVMDPPETLIASFEVLPWMLLVFEGIETEESADFGAGMASLWMLSGALHVGGLWEFGMGIGFVLLIPSTT